MKQLKLFAACCALSLLAAACGGAAEDEAAPFTTQASALKQSGKSCGGSGGSGGNHGDDHGDDDGHHGDDHHGDDHHGDDHDGDDHDDDDHDDHGTRLTVTSAVKSTTCTSTSSASVALSGSITTSGSVDSANLTVSIDGGAAQKVGVINPKDFVHNGRYKTAQYSVALPVPNGDHSLQLCFVQSGSQGRKPKATCAPAVNVHVDCAPPPPVDVCAGVTPAGGIQGTGEVCTTDATVIPVVVSGSFGSSPTLTITGPNGFTFTTTLTPSSSDPCNFTYEWNFANIAGAGDYTFTVTGNGHTFTFGAPLTCTKPPPTNACPDVVPGGKVLTDGNICNVNMPFLPISVQGDFGTSPVVTVTGPNGFTATATLTSTGTCGYQYMWSTADFGNVAGSYTFTVAGNNATVSFTSNLVCKPTQPM